MIVSDRSLPSPESLDLAVTPADRRDARAALAILNQIAVCNWAAFYDQDFDEVAGARTLLNSWLEKNAGGAS
jgi:hypothetical protein